MPPGLAAGELFFEHINNEAGCWQMPRLGMIAEMDGHNVH
jgi:hypothetical protein